ncbi:YdcF family protein [Chroococcidiopsis sp. TS-821]|uniref:YdcF family protein n=1 Tax=Chroococcidiopsis sp. TS-821 TaxID=1378066 RepID=UPI001AEFA81B|nr:YdcF family protein [Chroococcidiopsis sp. TS-821]
MLVLPLILLWGYKEIKSQLEPPQAILVLGGSTKREKFAAQFARKHPDIPIWISGGTPKDYAEGVFTDAGIDLDRLHLDYRAVDTVTNFTTLVDEFQAQGINKIYLITSDYHMRRARVIGSIVLGSRGVEFEPVPVPSGQSPEPVEKVLRDGARALLWLTTGRTGASLPSLGRRES